MSWPAGGLLPSLFGRGEFVCFLWERPYSHLLQSVARSSPNMQSPKNDRLSWPRRLQRKSPVCWIICCRSSRRRPASGSMLAVGTGQALDLGRRGDADVVLTHHKWSEEKFVAEGEGVKRYGIMYNDFVLIGPKNDPAGALHLKDIAKDFVAIQDK